MAVGDMGGAREASEGGEGVVHLVGLITLADATHKDESSGTTITGCCQTGTRGTRKVTGLTSQEGRVEVFARNASSAECTARWLAARDTVGDDSGTRLTIGRVGGDKLGSSIVADTLMVDIQDEGTNTANAG